MAKQGLINDYDLHASFERTAQGQTCAVCGASPMAFQWSDYSGQAMCTSCGCPYQLKWGSDEMETEGAYPYLLLREDLVQPLREYHAETGRFTCLGWMLGPRPGIHEFDAWLKARYPALREDCNRS